MSEEGLIEFMSTTRSSKDSSDVLIFTNDNKSFRATRLMTVNSSPFFDLNGPFKKQTNVIYKDLDSNQED